MVKKTMTRKELIDLLIQGLSEGGKMDDEVYLLVHEDGQLLGGYLRDCYNHNKEVVLNTRKN